MSNKSNLICGWGISSSGSPYSLTIHSTGKNLFESGETVINKTMPNIKQVIFQNALTIVVWADGERTIVKCSEEEFDKEKGLAMAIAKRFIDRNKFKKLIENANIQNK